MEYSLAKLHIPKKGNDWYVYYSFQNQEGEMKLFKVRGEINRIKNLKERKAAGNEIAAELNRKIKKEDWSPFQKQDEIPEYNKDFYWWFDERLKFTKAKHGLYNYKKLDNVQTRLKEFAPSLLTHQINYKFLVDFETHLIERGLHVNTIADYLYRVKIIVNTMVKSGAMEYHKNPFLNYKSNTVRPEKKRLKYDLIKQLEEKEILNPDNEQARDMYLLSFYCGGIRFGDICRLENEWFSETHLDYRMHKSKGKMSSKKRMILLVDQAQRIVNKYRNKGKYLFNTGVDWEDEEKSINMRNSTFNKRLKAACTEAEIPEVTYHTSRNSLADYGRREGLDGYGIKNLLGLSKIATAEVYLASEYQDESDSNMNKLFSK